MLLMNWIFLCSNSRTSAGDSDIIKLLQQPNKSLQPEQQSSIADAAHRILPEEIRIVRAHVYPIWNCVHFVRNEIKSEQKLNVYYFKNSKLLSDSMDKIEKWFEEPDFKPLCESKYEQISINVSDENAFLYAVATAFCIAMGLNVDDIKTYLGTNLSIEDVRKNVVDLLLEVVSLDASNATVWSHA